MSSIRDIILATRNPGKAGEIRQVLRQFPVQLVGVDQIDGVDEPLETGETFAQNARDKALYYAVATGQWSLADDSGLEVDALDGAPGVRSARWAADECPPGADRGTIDAANNAKLLAKLSGVGAEGRTARFVCHLALADPQGIVIETFGTIEGRIVETPRGRNGFGYDPLFWVDELGCTTAQLSTAEKNRISHRGKAVRRFAELLRDLVQRSG